MVTVSHRHAKGVCSGLRPPPRHANPASRLGACASSERSGWLLPGSACAAVQVCAGAFEDFIGEGWVGVGDGT